LLAATLTARTAIRVGTIVAAAIIVTLVVQRFVARFLRRLFGRTLPVDRPRIDARGKALSSALRAALVGAIWTTAVITVIGEFDISIGGFVATATIIGGAVAFGAQTLVRDVIAGFFVLSDDQFGVGDEVDLGHASGVVERVTLRTARLRDAEGRIWHVPHGNVARVANLSKNSIVLFDVAVARSMNAMAALDEVALLAATLAQDEAIAAVLLSPPQVLGINEIADDRFVIRASASTRLGAGDTVRHAWRVVLLNSFETGRLVRPPAPIVVEP
jgi:small conductance mechanosensitive channel